MNTTNHSGKGRVIGTILILAIIVIGLLYFWRNKSASPSPAMTDQSAALAPAHDESASIQADLNATDVDSVDSSLNNATQAGS